MNVQIIGAKKCQQTQKAERYFKERAIPYHFVDLTVRGLSKGELSKLKMAIGVQNLIDTEGKEYAKRNLKYMVHDVGEVLITHPMLLKTPVVRNGDLATVGYCPEIWRGWS
jgi:arsenate reductase-like glutaredoxin family protein